jgi:hypothetical protein
LPEQLSLNANAIGRPGTAALERRLAALEFLRDKALPVNVAWVYAESGASSADLNRWQSWAYPTWRNGNLA